jgi:hypothetical protein
MQLSNELCAYPRARSLDADLESEVEEDPVEDGKERG